MAKGFTITRRRMLAGLGVLGLAGGVGGVRYATASREDFLAGMIYRALPGTPFAPGAVEEFAAHQASSLDGDRSANLDKLVKLSAVLTIPGVDMALKTVEKYANFRRTTVTGFLLNSTYFHRGDDTIPVEYSPVYACGNNPFAKFA